jgi:hypothetical protein
MDFKLQRRPLVASVISFPASSPARGASLLYSKGGSPQWVEERLHHDGPAQLGGHATNLLSRVVHQMRRELNSCVEAMMASSS